MNRDSLLVNDLVPSPNHGDRRGKNIDSVILHYTGMVSGAAALARLCDPPSAVSCHYLVGEDGRITQIVPETFRAWHAGLSVWAGETDMNSVSVGIEIVNRGHDGGAPPYPGRQIDAVIALCRDICARHKIPAQRVLGHSDVAPERKIDPGEWFPWARFAAAGLGHWVTPAPLTDGAVLRPGDQHAGVEALQRALSALGFGVPVSGQFCAQTEAVVTGFQRHWRPARIDGIADVSTIATLKSLLASPASGPVSYRT